MVEQDRQAVGGGSIPIFCRALEEDFHRLSVPALSLADIRDDLLTPCQLTRSNGNMVEHVAIGLGLVKTLYLAEQHGHLQEHGPETVGVIKVAGRKASALQCREGFIHVFVLPGPDRDQAPYITLPNSRLETQFSVFARSLCRSGRPWLEQ